MTETRIARPDHSVSRADISPNALKVLYRLHNEGYRACLVGGGVRDLLLGLEPKDFDVATDAHPEQVNKIFRNCRLIGRRFRLAHVHFGREIIEVATFRALDNGDNEDGDRHVEDGRILRDNIYGTIDDDAWRRDFTVNALYYDIADFSVLDFTNGMADIEAGVLRLIGEPEKRYREDPVRMLRAVRFAAKLGFRIAPECESPMTELGELLDHIPAARLYDECLKLFLSGHAESVLEKLRHYGLFEHLFPQTAEALEQQPDDFPLTFLGKAMHNTDQRLANDLPVTPAFLFAALLWEPVRLRTAELMDNGMSDLEAVQKAGDQVVREQVQRISIPKRFSFPMREIWTMQFRLTRRGGKRPARLLGHPRFRAGYDFLLLRAEVGETDQELADWWTEFQKMDNNERQEVTKTARRRPRRRGRRRRRKSDSSASPG